GYFDRAYKWCGEFRISEIPGMKHYISSLENAFIRGFEKKDPVPIPEKELYEILESLVEIEFDNERQERVTRNQERLIRQMAGKLKTNI
ncbi:hypothetical protein KY308_02175, partial [Candidatus Woesearchaeota archaeon]|nr:hypothetical protein [Candidatus Woesearchaeota archaeon]